MARDGASAADLPADLQARVEALARELRCDHGDWTIEFQLMGGRLVKTRRHHGPIRNEELAQLARSDE